MEQSLNQNIAEIIFYKGYNNDLFSSQPSSKRFYADFRAAVITELETKGYCSMLDQIIEDYTSIDVVAAAALHDISNGYESGEMVVLGRDKEYSDYIPFTVKISWSKCQRFNVCSIHIDHKMRKTFRRCREIVRSAHAVHLSSVPDNALAHDKENKALEQAELVTQEATEKAEEIRTDAQKEAEQILNKAQNDAERIIQKAYASADEYASKTIREASETAKQRADELIGKFIYQGQRELKREIDQEMENNAVQFFEQTRRLDTIHREMCDATDAYQQKWITALDNAMKELTHSVAAAKTEFYNHLDSWKPKLYPKTLKPLAVLFTEMYTVINVDKLIRQEVLFREQQDTVPHIGKEQLESKEDLPTPALSEQESVSSESDSDNALDNSQTHQTIPSKVRPTDAILSGLEKLNKNMSVILRKYESALNCLDLYTFYPKPGELFDEIKHLAASSVECEGKRIAECMVPGIAKKADDDDGDYIMIPAQVRLETED